MMPRNCFFRNVVFPIVSVILTAFVFSGCGKKSEGSGTGTDHGATERTDSGARKNPGKVEAASKTALTKTDDLDADAKFDLALRYQNGDGVERDLAKAAQLYLEAAEQGHVLSQMLLARQYATGEGVDCDFSESARWYREAAENGIASAQFSLGMYYFDGKGVEQDYEEAVKWFRMAADNGYSEAQFNLGGCYALGLGVEKDYEEAAKWYRMAAENGDEDALDALKELESLNED